MAGTVLETLKKKRPLYRTQFRAIDNINFLRLAGAMQSLRELEKISSGESGGGGGDDKGGGGGGAKSLTIGTGVVNPSIERLETGSPRSSGPELMKRAASAIRTEMFKNYGAADRWPNLSKGKSLKQMLDETAQASPPSSA